jgi:hypothetical protein
MKKFTSISENKKNKSFKVNINLSIIVNTEDEGEAGYISDDIISAIDGLYDYSILNIEETNIIEEK